MKNSSVWQTIKRLSFVVSFLFFAQTATAQSRWSFELHGGEVFNMPLPLTVTQNGYPEIKITARYNSESFTLPVYWNMRLSRWQNDKAWELELIHHKLYLNNTTPDIQKFNISHGFNLIILNRGFEKKMFRHRIGVGMVLAHPESNIRGKEFGNSTDDKDLGYFLSGPVLNLSTGKVFRLNERFYFDLESKITYAFARVKVADGHARVNNLALHLIFGFGMDFPKKD